MRRVTLNLESAFKPSWHAVYKTQLFPHDSSYCEILLYQYFTTCIPSNPSSLQQSSPSLLTHGRKKPVLSTGASTISMELDAATVTCRSSTQMPTAVFGTWMALMRQPVSLKLPRLQLTRPPLLPVSRKSLSQLPIILVRCRWRR